MYDKVLLLLLALWHCNSLANYELFNGFNNELDSSSEDIVNPITAKSYPTTLNNKDRNSTDIVNSSKQNINEPSQKPPQTETFIECPDEEPANIGYYEVPTQKEVLTLIRTTLIQMFDGYKNEAIQFLKDVNQTSNATTIIENSCGGIPDRLFYKHCVKEVKSQWVLLTNKTMNRLQNKTQEITSSIKSKICKIRNLGVNPLKLMNIIAIEGISLKFAWSGFLRMLTSCSSICNSSYEKLRKNQKPRNYQAT